MSLNQEEVYIEYLNYDWSSFEEFNIGLSEILENYLEGLKEHDPLVTSIPPLDRRQLEDQAKCFFYCSHSGNILNLDDFETWKRQYGAQYATDKSRLADQKVEPVETAKIVEIKQDATNEPPYSSNYQDLVELIVSGKPIPGIKDIPDTVLGDQKSVAEVKQRRKPWEKETEEQPAAKAEKSVEDALV